MIYAVIPHFPFPSYPPDDEYYMDPNWEENWKASKIEFLNNIKQRVIAINDGSYNLDFYPPIGYIVYNGTSLELARRLGFNDTTKDTGVVIQVSDINGWFSKSLWDWINVNQNQ